MKKLQISLLATILFLFCHTGLQAQTSTVGTMTINKGIVKLRRNLIDNIYKTAGEKIPVNNRDEIQTGKDSNVTITLKARDDKLELFSQSFFKIDQVTSESSQLSMSIGKARFKIKKGRRPLKSRKKRKKRFRVRTANAIVGVKGTEFVMAAGTDVTSVLTIEGVVDVASVAAPEIEVEVGENQASQIKQASAPTAPVSLPLSVRENILSADTPNAFNNVTFGKVVPITGIKQESKKKSSSTGEKTTGQKSSSSPKAESGGTATAPGGQTTGTTGAAAVLTPGPDESTEENTPATADGESEQTGETDTQAVFGSETGDEDAFSTEDEGAEGPDGDNTINLETIETAELEDFDVEEPDIDPDDIFDPDDIIDEINDDTDDLQDELDELDEIVENQLQEIEIKIRYE